MTEVRRKEVRGLATAWLEAGASAEAPLLVFLHGFPDSAASWDFQIDAFKERFHVVAPFARGAGPSAGARGLGRYDPDAAALDVLAILDEVDPGKRRPVVLVGHDLGAVHAWHLAAFLPGRVAGLVILNGLTIRQMLGRWRNPRQLAKSWYMFLMQVPLLPDLIARGAPGAVLKLAHSQGGLPPPLRPAATAVRGALAGPLRQYRAFLRAAPRLARRPRRRLDCPVLVMWGAEDAFLVPPTTAELSLDAADLTIRILPGNHWLHRTMPDKVNALIGDFLASHGVNGVSAR